MELKYIVFKSSKKSLWPIQVTLGLLPPNKRFLHENVLIVGLYVGDKPDISKIIIPFAEEMQNLQEKGIHLFHNNQLIQFLPKVLFCSSDIPARAEIQNCTHPSGYYGCPCCLQRGESIKNPKTSQKYVRFVKGSQPSALRTHQMALDSGQSILNKLNYDTKGIKGLSSMIAFKDYDLSRGFAIDYMHGALSGATNLLVDIWLGTKKLRYQDSESYRFKPLSPQQRLELNRRIMSLKPTTQIRHKPRPIHDRGFFTADEYRSILWYYLPFSLSGLIDRKLINNFKLLSDATYILCKTQITRDEVLKAGSMLRQFADEFQHFYGVNAVTINIHMLRHYVESVLNSGPLWCHSMFTFEITISK